ncbi:MAG: DUF3365 domain-containing protein [Bacteroidetes bacterium]|nr:DUF3365 domain-containing protein [Bacteroidota bacterium]
MNYRFLLFGVAFFSLILFQACENQSSKKENTFDEKAMLEKGKQVAAKTFATLSGALQKAIKEGGIPNAIQYCKLNALSIKDSLSKAENATIRRTSLKIRNPEDTPTKSELKILNQYQQLEKEGKDIKPIVRQLESGNIIFYAPIRVNEFCLQCHGKIGETLTEENHQIIQNKYPTDQAIGYNMSDLRGIWSIEFQ